MDRRPHTPTGVKRSLQSVSKRGFLDKTSSISSSLTVPLPGLRELRLVADSVANCLKDPPFQQDRCSALKFKARSLMRSIEGMTFLGLEDVRELKSELQNIQATFNKAFSSNRRDYRKAELQLERLDDLGQRLDYLVELTKVRVHANAYIPSEVDIFTPS
ncbi:hypothetical protein FRC09_000646 [Ceratobasidium sp. 395]|nr:hypothetical protein FRC09_000646 [Ceratobasidium sp. 395]